MHRWLTKAQVAEKLGIHPNTVYRLEQRSGFPRRSEALGNPRWRDDEIEEFMERNRKVERSTEPFQAMAKAGESKRSVSDARQF